MKSVLTENYSYIIYLDTQYQSWRRELGQERHSTGHGTGQSMALGSAWYCTEQGIGPWQGGGQGHGQSMAMGRTWQEGGHGKGEDMALGRALDWGGYGRGQGMAQGWGSS
jgi:hypothetical protein